MKSDIIYNALKTHRRDFDYSYHFEKIQGDIRQVLIQIVEDEKITTKERLSKQISWEGIVFISSLLFIFFLISYWIIAPSGANSNYDKCVFTAINQLEKSADIISLCKEFKK